MQALISDSGGPMSCLSCVALEAAGGVMHQSHRKDMIPSRKQPRSRTNFGLREVTPKF